MLYRKYRPQQFIDIIGQEHVVQTLQGALSSTNVGHAYLFTGPRGTGKTTMARLFAKALNCMNRIDTEPCNKCDNCVAITHGNSLDLIEIDAASNRGIDEIRGIRESAQVSSSGGRYKIFIIDEVHMLTTAAFNALLKILEEPPANVVFVLATTEVHKVLDTILSRVQRFDFRLLTQKQIVDTLQTISNAEKFKITVDGLEMITTYARGSLRDGLSALTKVMAHGQGNIEDEQVMTLLGVVSIKVLENLVTTFINKDAKSALNIIDNIYTTGTQMEYFSKQMLEYLRQRMIESIESNDINNISPHEYVLWIDVFTNARIELKSSPIPTLPLELAVIKITKK